MAESNPHKHRVSLEAACGVFFDPLIRLKWAIRIISARPATAAEGSHYED